MIGRKQVLKMLASFPFVGSMLGAGLMSREFEKLYSKHSRRDYFTELGVRRLINGRGSVTTLTGTLMDPSVIEAMNYASRNFVNLNELNEKVGRRISEMLNCEDAHVTAGAASAITLAVAAAVTGKDRNKINTIPNIPGPQKEVIMPRNHRIYEQQITLCGVKIVEAEGPDEMRKKINDNTVLAFYNNKAIDKSISREDFVQIGKDFNVPTFNDCASEVPPVENLYKYIEMGFDLVTFSGGKEIEGPQSAGLLFGRRDLIEAARFNHCPYSSIGRGMKVNKEEVLGMMVALEAYLARDHTKQREQWDQMVQLIATYACRVPTVEATFSLHSNTNQVPRVKLSWDPSIVKITSSEVLNQLREGNPSIEAFGGDDSIAYRISSMQPHEARIVGQRTKEILQQAV